MLHWEREVNFNRHTRQNQGPSPYQEMARWRFKARLYATLLAVAIAAIVFLADALLKRGGR